MPTYAEAVDLFERRRQAWLREDVDAYLGLWADDMTFQSPVHPEPLGRVAFTELIKQSAAFSKPVSFVFDQLAVEGDFVLAEWTIAIERRDSGKRIEWRGMSVAEIRNGLIRVWREYWNPLLVMGT